MKGRMVPAAPPIRKLRVVGRSRRNAGFRRWKRPVSASLHRGLAAPVYDFALGIGDELVSYTLKKPRKTATRYYAHANHLYSVAAVTSATGSIVERWSYNAYGVPTIKNSANATIAKSAVGNDRGFTGYKLDSESGLYAARARMHSPRIGRFISRDFIGYVDGNNLYFSYFSPNFVDPYGLAAAAGQPCSKGSSPETVVTTGDWNFTGWIMRPAGRGGRGTAASGSGIWEWFAQFERVTSEQKLSCDCLSCDKCVWQSSETTHTHEKDEVSLGDMNGETGVVIPSEVSGGGPDKNRYQEPLVHPNK